MAKIFTIEGIDGSGKQTVTKLLKDKLIESGRHTISMSFPEYETNTGKSVRDYLGGKFKLSDDDLTNPYFASLLYILNRAEYFKSVLDTEAGSIKETLDRNKDLIVISDRYFLSNVIHQGSRIYDMYADKTKFIYPVEHMGEMTEFIEWVIDCEFNKVGNPRPIKNYILNLSYATAAKRVVSRTEGNKHGAGMDIHENLKHLCSSFCTINLIRSINELKDVVYLDNIENMSPEEITERIYKDILSQL